MPTRMPRHVGIIPDGNRRWAEARGLPRAAGYAAGIQPGLELLLYAAAAGVEEVTAYGFTKENVRRPHEQVRAFQDACVELALRAVDEGAGLLVVGDSNSPLFPDALRPFVDRRAPGRLRFNLLVNYGWEWDLAQAIRARPTARSKRSLMQSLGSAGVSRVDLVLRWGGRRRLSGFLPLQCAYADFYPCDTLWPDMRCETLADAFDWYAKQDVTLGG
jgi:undecaprenyl diphosphate synthase